MKKIIFFLTSFCISVYSYSQPVNDNPCGAITIPVHESADPCTLQTYTITGATYLNLVLPTDCNTSTQRPDAWYIFSSTSSSVSIKMGCGFLYTLYTASNCNGPFTLLNNCHVCTINSGEMTYAITPGATYYIKVLSSNPSTSNFSIDMCIYTNQVPASSRVGINTMLPTENLDVAGTAKFRNTVKFAGNVGFESNVGIGTNAPTTAKLVIGGSAGTEGIDLSSSDQYANMRVIRNSLSSIDKDMHIGFQSGANSSLHLYSNNIETITAKNGNIGIGTTTPNAALQFSNTAINRKLVLWETANNDHQYYGFGINGGTLRYQVNDVLAQHIFYAATGTGTSQYCFNVHGDGNLFAPGTLTSTSDARLKKNIAPLGSILNKLTQLNAYTYNWISPTRDQRQQLGVLAQEVQELFPQLVTEFKGDHDENTLGVNYLGLIPVLIESIKELKKENDKQQKQIEELKQIIKLKQ